MIKYNIYIITCDKSNWILNVTIPLLEKYWNINKSIKILGFSKPDVILPVDYDFISMRPIQLSIDDWSKDIYSIISKDINEFCVFMLDDFLPLDYINDKIFKMYLNKMNYNKNIVRCGLGSDMQFLPHHIIETHNDFDFIEIEDYSPYRLTTQPSIWRTEYLLKYLKESKNPWDFEVNHNPSDKKQIISTIRDYCYYYICESALSNRYPNKINILGMKHDDIKYFVDNKIFDINLLQYGMHYGKVPQFIDYLYSFNLDILKDFVNENKYNEYKIRYYKSY